MDIGAVAKEFGGGGHKNAAGCTSRGGIDALQKLFVEKIEAAQSMDGLLIIDKPSGPTSHDVVARDAARARASAAIGHTGTLDPAAPACCRWSRPRDAARRFLSAGERATKRSFASASPPTPDAKGQPVGPSVTTAAAVARRDRGGARRVSRHISSAAAGVFGEEDRRTRSYKLARARSRPSRAARPRCSPSFPPRARRRPSALDLVNVDADSVTLRVDCSAGFYVRALAHDLGERLGTGAHLAALRRTSSGDFTLADAIALDALEREPRRGRRAS